MVNGSFWLIGLFHETFCDCSDDIVVVVCEITHISSFSPLYIIFYEKKKSLSSNLSGCSRRLSPEESAYDKLHKYSFTGLRDLVDGLESNPSSPKGFSTPSSPSSYTELVEKITRTGIEDGVNPLPSYPERTTSIHDPSFFILFLVLGSFIFPLCGKKCIFEMFFFFISVFLSFGKNMGHAFCWRIVFLRKL